MRAERHERWSREADCEAAARRLAARPALRDALVTLRGPLGAGKTTFARHLLRALGVAGRIRSPSYALLEPYTLADGTEVAHFDFYRFDDPREWEDAGLRDAVARPGLRLVEWPEHAAALLPHADLDVAIEPLDETRREVTLRAFTATGEALIA